MSIELILALYLTLIAPALSFIITPYLRSYQLMLFASITSLASIISGTWILAKLLPLTTKLVLSPIPSSDRFWEASLSVSGSEWRIFILLIPWLIILIVAGRLVIGFTLLAKKTRGFEPADSRSIRLLEELAKKAGIKPPRLFLSDMRGIAFSTTDSIYISRHIADSLSDDKLKALLAHELMHIERHDQISRWCFLVLASLSLLVPSFVVHKRYDLRVELDTDSQASNILGNRIVLAETIVACARMTIPQSDASNFTSLDSITARVKALVESNDHGSEARTFKPLLLSVMTMFVCMTVLATAYAIPHNTTPVVGNLNPEQVEKLIDGEMIATLTRSYKNPENFTVNLQPKDSIQSEPPHFGYRYCKLAYTRRRTKHLLF